MDITLMLPYVISFIFQLEPGKFIDCDPTKTSQQGHVGVYSQDPCSDGKVQLKWRQCMDDVTHELLPKIEFYITKSSWEAGISGGEELFISYGKWFWQLQENWNMLSMLNRSQLMLDFNIDPVKDLIHFENDKEKKSNRDDDGDPCDDEDDVSA